MCAACSLGDARRLDTTARVYHPTEEQKGMGGYREAVLLAAAELRERDKTLKRIVAATAGTTEFSRLLGLGLDSLLDTACRDCGKFRSWLQSHGVRRVGGYWTDSRGAGRVPPSTVRASG